MGIYVTDTERGVKVHSKSAFWKPLCNGWLDCMADYAKAEPGDWPFWYGERPLIGFLAGGIWAAGGTCIEEYQTNKKPRIAEQPNESFLGRGDLYFNTGRHQGKIEFKMHDIGVSRTRDFAGFLKKKLKDGERDARKGLKEGTDRFAGIFLRPYIGKYPDTNRYDANLKHLLTSAWNTVRPDALAWWCPTNQVLETDVKDTKDWVVGVILLMKQVK